MGSACLPFEGISKGIPLELNMRMREPGTEGTVVKCAHLLTPSFHGGQKFVLHVGGRVGPSTSTLRWTH